MAPSIANNDNDNDNNNNNDQQDGQNGAKRWIRGVSVA